MTPDERLYHYRFAVTKVIDGDTVRGRLDLGCRTYRELDLRLYGINAPEMKGESHAAGLAARNYLIGMIQQLSEEGWLIVQTQLDKNDKYGRLLATLWGVDDDGLPVNLNQRMLADGHACTTPESWG